jgi:hypothetical protein
MPMDRVTKRAGTFLRDVSDTQLRGLCLAAHALVVSAMWFGCVGPAVRERQELARDVERIKQDQGVYDGLHQQLAHIQGQVQRLRGELVAIYPPDEGENRDQTIRDNRIYAHIEATAAQSGLRIRSFERAMQGSISAADRRLSNVVLGGTFVNLMRFAEVVAAIPTAQRLDEVVVSVSEDTPEMILLSVTLSEEVALSYESTCAGSTSR